MIFRVASCYYASGSYSVLLNFGVGVSGLSNQLAIVVLHALVIYCTVHLERGVLVQSIYTATITNTDHFVICS